MKWRDVLIGAVSTLMVTILASVAVYYLTKEPQSPQPRENLIYSIEASSFEMEATEFALLTVRVGNLGEMSAENASIGVRFEGTTKIIDKSIALSTGPAGNYTIRKATEQEIELVVPTLVPDEIVTISFMLNEEPARDPEVGVKSQNSVGSVGTFVRTTPAPGESRLETVTEWLIIAVAAFQLPLVVYGLRRVRKTRRGYAQTINNTAFAYIHCGIYHEAKQMLAHEINTHGGDAFILSNYALCLSLDEEFDEAEKRLAAAELLAASGHEEAVLYFNQTLVSLLQEKISEGLKALNKAFDASPKEVAEYCSRSVIVGDLNKKIRELEVTLNERS